MGGHGHGHDHKPPYEIPSPDIYKVEDVSQLKELQEKLAKKGLKDPWLRNEVWRFEMVKGKNTYAIPWRMFRGWKIGVPAFLLTIAAEHYFNIDYSGGHGHDDHGHH